MQNFKIIYCRNAINHSFAFNDWVKLLNVVHQTLFNYDFFNNCYCSFLNFIKSLTLVAFCYFGVYSPAFWELNQPLKTIHKPLCSYKLFIKSFLLISTFLLIFVTSFIASLIPFTLYVLNFLYYLTTILHAFCSWNFYTLVQSLLYSIVTYV